MMDSPEPVKATVATDVEMGAPVMNGQPVTAGTAGKWSSNVCDCCNGDSCSTCCTHTFCACFTYANMYSKVFNNKSRFALILALMWIMYIAHGAIGNWYNGKYNGACPCAPAILIVPLLLCALLLSHALLRNPVIATRVCNADRLKMVQLTGDWMWVIDSTYGTTSDGFMYAQLAYTGMGIVIIIVTTCIGCTIRTAIKKRDGIQEDECATCCLSCCCCISPCAFCQMMRHEGLTDKNYKMWEPMGSAVVSV